MTFGEDHCRIRKDHAPQNMATLRQVSHNLLKNETSLKVGIQGKRLQAGWKEDDLLKVTQLKRDCPAEAGGLVDAERRALLHS